MIIRGGRICLSVLCALLPVVAAARGEGAVEAEETRWTWFPIIAFAPETSLQLGALNVVTFESDEDGEARRSSIFTALAFTLKKQVLVAVGPNLYFDGETWGLEIDVGFNWFPDTFWGVGADSPDAAEEDFTRRALGLETVFTRQVDGGFRAGVVFQGTRMDITEEKDEGLIASGAVPGHDGGIWYGAGPVVMWDTRDSNFAPRRGARHRVSAVRFADAVGSDFDFTRFVADLRTYYSVAPTHQFALQLLAVALTGAPPFQAMAALGGGESMRGYYGGRYRDRHLVAAQAEYRFPLAGDFTGATFAGAGDVAHTVGGFEVDSVEIAGGVGFRYAINPEDRVRIRLDIAGTSDGDVNVYVNLGEAF